MTCGVAQALRLGMTRVACVSTGNTSASMAAYASAAGLQPVIFIPHGNIAFGKLAQALEYGARTIQVDANFDQILALVRQLAEKLGIYLLNSINPFRIEGQKTIMAEMLDQRDWLAPDWIVLPGGNLGNISAFGKGLRELKELGLIHRLPRLAVIQAEGAAPFYELVRSADRSRLNPVEHPETLATAIKIRRSCVLAQGLARDRELRWRGRKSRGAGDCRCQGGDRAMRHWLRTGIGRHPGRDPQTHPIRSHPRRRRRGGGADRKCPEGCGLHSSVPHWNTQDHARCGDSGQFWKSTGRDAQ